MVRKAGRWVPPSAARVSCLGSLVGEECGGTRHLLLGRQGLGSRHCGGARSGGRERPWGGAGLPWVPGGVGTRVSIPAVLLQISACLHPIPASITLSGCPDPPRFLLFCRCCLPLLLYMLLPFWYATCYYLILLTLLLKNVFLRLQCVPLLCTPLLFQRSSACGCLLGSISGHLRLYLYG